MKSIAALLSICLSTGLVACRAPSKQSTSLLQVSDLLGSIERVHVECQISQEGMRSAMTRLHRIANPSFDGDAVTAYAEFLEAFKASERREVELRRAAEAMKAAAEPFFTKWLRNQRAYTNPDMRLRSRARLTETRERFEAIVTELEPTLSEFSAVNDSLRDHAIFLGTDFNKSAVAQILDQVQLLTQAATQLDGRFEECLRVTEEYVAATALPIPQPVEEPAGEESTATGY